MCPDHAFGICVKNTKKRQQNSHENARKVPIAWPDRPCRHGLASQLKHTHCRYFWLSLRSWSATAQGCQSVTNISLETWMRVEVGRNTASVYISFQIKDMLSRSHRSCRALPPTLPKRWSSKSSEQNMVLKTRWARSIGGKLGERVLSTIGI